MAPARFDHLPPELLYMVLGYLGVHCDGTPRPEEPLEYLRDADLHWIEQPTWYSLQCEILSTLCLVSPNLRQVVQPILFREFMPGYGNSYHSTHYSWEGRLTSFMRAIADRPHLAEHVKRIYIHRQLLRFTKKRDLPDAGAPKRLGHSDEHTKETEDCGEALQAVPNALGIERPQQLSLRDSLSALIAQLPNLSHCSLQIDGSSTEEILLPCALGLGRAMGIPRPGITTLDIASSELSASSDTLFYLSEHTRALLDACPSLETLTLHKCAGISTQGIKIPPLPKLKTLQVTRSSMTATDIDALVSCCNSLRKFVYEAGDPYLSGELNLQSHHPRVHFRASHALQVLRRHRATLESVHLDLRLRYDLFSVDEEDHPPPVSLQDFHVLRHLYLNLPSLYDILRSQSSGDGEGSLRLLPPNIASLHLALGKGAIESAQVADGLLLLGKAASQGMFSNLREVRCSQGQKPGNDSALTMAFAKAGVDFGYRSYKLIREAVPPVMQVYPDPIVCYNPAPVSPGLPLPDEDDSDL